MIQFLNAEEYSIVANHIFDSTHIFFKKLNFIIKHFATNLNLLLRKTGSMRTSVRLSTSIISSNSSYA